MPTLAEAARCPIEVRHPVMMQRWSDLAFLHWSYDPHVVQQLLPPGLRVETQAERAWIGLIPFRMMVRPPQLPAVPWLSHFPETNVRTYVRAEDGSTGVWFFSLDAGRLPAVAGGRVGYLLRYHWSQMSIAVDESAATYQCERRWPAPVPARSRTSLAIGPRYRADELTLFDHWLTARFTLFSYAFRRIWTARADHPPWPLHRATVTDLDDSLITAAGLPEPQGEPIVHWTPGVDVKVSRPMRAGQDPSQPLFVAKRDQQPAVIHQPTMQTRAFD